MPNLNNQVSGSAIAFIDTQVENYQSLIAGVKPGTEVVVLDGNRDAIDQITQILALRTNIDSIHIVSHGTPGSLQLGNGCLSADNLETYSERLQQWRSALNLGADILIYGCNVASAPRAYPKVRQGMNSLAQSSSRLKPTAYPKVRQGMNSLSQSSSRLKPTENKSAIQSSSEDFRYETGVSTPGGSAGNGIDDEQAIDRERAIDLDGVAFIQRIAQLTNTNVAASQNLTGSVAKGGDWELEVRTGEIETPLVFEAEVLAGYEYVLNTFGAAANIGVGTNPYGIATGDFDLDDQPDLAVTNQGSDTVSILLGNGTGGFDPAPIPTLTVSNASSIAVGNFNNDNFSDLAVVGSGTGGALSIFLGNGTGGFGSPTQYPTGVSPISVAVGKFNNDNFSDVAVVNASPGSTSGTVTILLANNTGSGALNFNTNLSAQSIPAFMTVGDFNGDTFSDLAVPNSLSNTISVFLANGSGDFGAATNLGAGTNPNSVANGDFNGDNFLDLAVVNGGSNNVSILLGNGTGGFGAANGFSAGTGLQGIVAQDFSGDGKLDLAVGGTGGAAILVGNGNGGFSAPINFAAGTDPTSIIAGNFNADTLPDLAVANNSSDNVSVLLNTPNTVSFVPPKIGNTYNVDEATTDTVIDVPVTISGGTPLSDVTVPIVIDTSSTATQGADYTLSTTSLTFSAGTTTLTQNIPVTIKADNIVDSNEQIVLNFGTITGGVADASQGKVAILDRNSSYSIVADNPTVTEGNSGATPATFTITRNGSTELWSTVDYAITGTATNGTDYNNIGGTSGATAATGKISFAAGETSKTISLDVLGDGNIEPDETVAITLSNSVSPGGAPTIATATATATIKNDDTAGITVSPKAISTTEVGGKAEFTVKLNAAPTANVTIDLSGFNPAEGTVSPNSLTFTPANYSEQTITVTGVDDLVADGPLVYKIVTAAAVSTDANYNNLDPDDIDVTNSDNETPGITVNPTAGLTTGEDGTKANFTVVLNTQPTADVTIGLTSDNVAEGTVSPASITFTPANWNTPQPVTVTGVNDGIVDGDIGYKIVTAAAVSTDANYSNRDVADVSLSNQDNDAAGISITTTATTATEGGANGSYAIELTSEPIAPVTINFNAGSEINAIAPITFDSTNWNVAKTVTVTATDDSKAEGTHSGTIAHTVTSTDTKYTTQTVQDVNVAITDNDTAGVSITPTSTSATEGGVNGNYGIKLTSEPSAPVTITLTTGEEIEAIAPITFTADNWNVAKTVTVKAVDDTIVEGAHSANISHSVSGGDAKYNAVVVPGVTVAITDNDTTPPLPTPTPPLPTPTPPLPTPTLPLPTPTPPLPTPTPPLPTPTPPLPTPTPPLPTPTPPLPTPTPPLPTPTPPLPTPTPPLPTPTPPLPTPTPPLPTPTPPVAVDPQPLGSPGIIISPASGLVTTEAGGTDQFTIRLNSQPTADVTIGLRSSNEAEGVISTESITFNSVNWNQWQPITITGVDDRVFDGDKTYQIVTAPAVSADSSYNGLDAPDANVVNRDNETASNARVAADPSTGVEYKPGELLVKLRPNVNDAAIQSVFQVNGAIAIEDLVPPSLQINSASEPDELEQWRVVKLASNADLLATQTSLAQDPRVETVELNYLLSINSVPNDPQFTQLWGLNNTGQTGGTPDADIDAPEAWDLQRGSKNVVVAVIDTGVDYNHQDLAANMWTNSGEIAGNGIDDDDNGIDDDVRGYDFINKDNDPMDDEGHGSHVAGTIGAAGNNNIGVVGVSPNVSIMPLKFIGFNGRGSTSDAVRAVDYATKNGAKVINASFGNPFPSQAMFNAIGDANKKGVLFIAAAGNDSSNNDSSPSYPSNYDLPNVISVAATNYVDQLSWFSNYGKNTVDLAAPGGTLAVFPPDERDIRSTRPNNQYGWDAGTSMAAPHVAGAAALLLAQNPSLTVTELKNILMTTTDPLPSLQGTTVSGGRLNLRKALNQIFDADSVFTDTNVPISGLYSAIWGDYNNDGKLDILGNNRTYYNTGIYDNTGQRLSEVGFSEADLPGYNPIWGDFNNDGRLDATLTNTNLDSNNSLRYEIYRNVPNNTYSNADFKLETVLRDKLPSTIFSSSWADYNNDGRPDLLLNTQGSYPEYPIVTTLYRNTGAIAQDRFKDSEARLDTGEPLFSTSEIAGATSSGVWADYDNDGKLDILIKVRESQQTQSGQQRQKAKLYRNLGDGVFKDTNVSLPGLGSEFPRFGANVYDMAWGDYDNDGKLDILLTGAIDGANGSGQLFTKVYRNTTSTNGSASFEDIGAQIPGYSQAKAAWGDYDNNGKLDILVTGWEQENPQSLGTSVTKIYYQNTGNGFTDSGVQIDSGAEPGNKFDSYPAWGDYDKDGKLDILLTGSSTNNPYGFINENDFFTKVFRNNTAIANTPPSPPALLPAEVSGRDVTFKWNRGTDDLTPDLGLSYNLRVTGSDGKDILSPMSWNIDGTRQLVGLGNVSQNTQWQLKDLPRGTYNWGVQAIDTAWAGSLFAPGGTFRIENSPPEKKISLGERTTEFNQPIKDVYTDADGDQIFYRLTLDNGASLESGGSNTNWLGLQFNPWENTITFTGTPPSNAKPFEVKLIATDDYGGSSEQTFKVTTTTDGRWVIDGYISGATVFLDANKNGILDTNEPSTTTDTGGKFNLNIPFETFDTNTNGEIDPSEGNLVATGGIDTATGLPLETPVTAPPDASVVTLLTSLVADLIDKGIEPEEAQSLVKAALSLPADVDLTSLDPIEATNNNQPGGVQVLSEMVKVQNFITQTSGLIDGASSAVNTDIVKAVVSSITAQIQSGTVLNLSNAAALEPIIQQAAAKIQQIDPSFNTQQVSQITSQSATVMATANQRIDAAVSNPTGTSIPESLARLQQVALGPTTQDFKEVGTGNKPISQLVADNTGTALDSRIETVILPTGIATPVVSGDADLGSNSPDAILGTNGDDILSGDSGNNVLMGMRGNDSLDGVLGNDTVFGGKGSDTILGSGGDDALFGNRGADILNGDDGNDILYGGKGDDLLNGGLGIDTLVGGMGVDKFLLSTNSGTDTITDFEVGKDLLVLGNGLSFSQLAIAQDSGATLIRLAQTGEVLASLGGVSANSISAANFGLI
ncbi:Subtilisin [Oscillatoria nigro-viridis PCC 7112]|uniref:Subtilisin n=1 Tax=Phormidium nigroviride PCC 7112 TaxID=179408 RepID=K9VH89_9CYAN|nr:S8 family serine peptidase [Oscillatoria nigro-viridis]AFZ07458.1 Subtilisin [Oscillatoria nigro-viridis PCC 7112]